MNLVKESDKEEKDKIYKQIISILNMMAFYHDDDIYIVEGLHTSLISLELEGKKVLTPGETKVYNPFPIEGYTTWEELGEPSHIYYISLEEPEYIWFFAEYPTEKVLDFNYMMYHFVVNKVDYR